MNRDDDVADGGAKKYYGKYRGRVMSNVDPKNCGRLLVQVVDVLAQSTSSWALPCLPFAGPQAGALFLPPVNAGVWVEFLQGDPNKPIWTGCFWGTTAEVPPTVLASTPGTSLVVMQTIGKKAIVMTDGPFPAMPGGGILLTVGASTLTITPEKISINAPNIEINGKTDINKGALLVT